MDNRIFLCIDLKSFYASVECIERGLDPMTTNLLVADASRTEKTICLAVSPSLKAYGISGRARLFEAVQQVKKANVQPYQKTITLFRRGGGYRATAILFDKGQRGNDNGGFVHGACHAAHVPTRYVREERATAGSDYTAICGSEVSSPQRATLSDQQFLYRPCAAGAIR